MGFQELSFGLKQFQEYFATKQAEYFLNIKEEYQSFPLKFFP